MVVLYISKVSYDGLANAQYREGACTITFREVHNGRASSNVKKVTNCKAICVPSGR